jgi:uncharacterized membrane protein
MLLFAVTALEKAEKVPLTFWFKVIGCIVAFAFGLFILRKVAHMNKIFLLIIVGCVGSIVGFQWIYERNEPEFLTPAVNVIAQFFPTKGSYGNKQTQENGAPGAKKSNPPSPGPKR